MEIKIHRGTHQIGGCVTEIQSNSGTRIIIDIGQNLPTEDGRELSDLQIEGLTEGKSNIDAVFVTHYHGDHIGLFNKILSDIPIYVGEVSKEIYKILEQRLANSKIIEKEDLKRIDKFKTYKIPDKIIIKDIVIIPIEVDHSAFDAHMLLIECDGKKVLHTGDFRTHGQRGKSVIPALEKYVGKVDCLICEGTILSRKKETLMTERELQYKAEKIFKENKNSFIMCSSTNIDRIAAFHKASLKANRIFICDKYQKNILEYIDSISRSGLYKFNNVYSYANNLNEIMENRGFVMLVRPNELSKEMMTYFPNNVFIYSQWKGYLNPEKKEYKYIQDFVPSNYTYLHTSGHADFESIQNVCQTVKPNILIPIHGEEPEGFRKMNLEQCNIIIANDGMKVILL